MHSHLVPKFEFILFILIMCQILIYSLHSFLVSKFLIHSVHFYLVSNSNLFRLSFHVLNSNLLLAFLSCVKTYLNMRIFLSCVKLQIYSACMYFVPNIYLSNLNLFPASLSVHFCTVASLGRMKYIVIM